MHTALSSLAKACASSVSFIHQTISNPYWDGLLILVIAAAAFWGMREIRALRHRYEEGDEMVDLDLAERAWLAFAHGTGQIPQAPLAQIDRQQSEDVPVG